MIDMNEVVTGVTLTKACSVKADEDTEKGKTINLRVKFDGVTLGDVFAKAVSSAVIAWQNGVGRKQFDTLQHGHTVDIQFKAPGARAQIDHETAMVLKLQAMTPTERTSYLKELVAKVPKEPKAAAAATE